MSSSRPSLGSLGTMAADCTSRSATSHPPSSSRRSTAASRKRPRRKQSRNELSGEAGAVHFLLFLPPLKARETPLVDPEPELAQALARPQAERESRRPI